VPYVIHMYAMQVWRCCCNRTVHYVFEYSGSNAAPGAQKNKCATLYNITPYHHIITASHVAIMTIRATWSFTVQTWCYNGIPWYYNALSWCYDGLQWYHNSIHSV